MRRRFTRYSSTPNSAYFTLVLMGALLVALFFGGDDLADGMSRVFAPAAEQEKRELPPTLEAQIESGVEEGDQGGPRLAGEHVANLMREAGKRALKTLSPRNDEIH